MSEQIEVGDIVRLVNILYLDDGSVGEKILFKRATKKVYRVIDTQPSLCKAREVKSKRELPWIGMFRFEILFKKPLTISTPILPNLTINK